MATEKQELKQQQDAVLRETQRKTAFDSASLFSSASLVQEKNSPAMATKEDSLAMTTEESKLLNVFDNKDFLKDNNLKFTADEEGNGGTLTPADTKKGADPSYSVHFAPNTGGGFTATVTGDMDKGLDAAFTMLKEAGVKETVISGKRIETDDAGYKVMKQALEHGITPVLAHEGVYGSVELFAKQGEKENSQNNEADTKEYLESIVANNKLRPQLVDGMVKAGLVEADKRDTVTNDELVEKGLKDVMSKAQAAAENEVKMSPANAPEAGKSPSALKDNSGMIGSSAEMKKIEPKKIEPKPTSSTADEEKKGLVQRSLGIK